jgi:hypothetical protein
VSNEPRPVTAVLAEAIEAAAYAPSVHNTQPWRWRIDGDDLLLYADRDRQLLVSDPDGRMLTVSCGAAMAYARTALAAEGYGCTVETMPEPADPDLLARASVTGRVPVDADSMRLFQTALIRHTDRRPVSDTPVPPGAVRRAPRGGGVGAREPTSRARRPDPRPRRGRRPCPAGRRRRPRGPGRDGSLGGW